MCRRLPVSARTGSFHIGAELFPTNYYAFHAGKHQLTERLNTEEGLVKATTTTTTTSEFSLQLHIPKPYSEVPEQEHETVTASHFCQTLTKAVFP